MEKAIKILLVILFVSICIFLTDTILDEIPNKGTFDELIINKLNPDIQFASMNISKDILSNYRHYSREEENFKKINEVISYLGELELIETSETPKVSEIDAFYQLYFYSENRNMIIGLHIWPPKYLKVFSQEEKLTSYKIVNDINFVEYIEDLFNSIPEN